MPQPAGPQDAEAFVGRSRELAVLSARLRQAATGDARLALVSGEPGIGKTELARAFARAAARTARWCCGAARGKTAAPRPTGPGCRCSEATPGRPGPERSPTRPGRRPAVLAQLLPELGPAHGGHRTSGSAARLTLFEAVCAVLDQASRTVPLVVILDDLHAAGPPLSPAAALRGGRPAVPGPAARHLPHRRGGRSTRTSAT